MFEEGLRRFNNDVMEKTFLSTRIRHNMQRRKIVISKLYQGHTLLYCDTLNELWFLPMTLCTTLYFLATASEKSTLIQGLHASNFRLIF